ncbi:hypothetical protein ACAG25_07835 [Mycobacterium sp. pV006]|uniref:hypothetical protein n=1 Tax=Mycobacterium sp. pV006 TaxID=3238983 RepID=UPI00351AF37E
MTIIERLCGLDSRAWSTATWLAPLITQLILAFVIVIAWLLGRWFPGTGAVPLLLVGLAATFSVCAITAFILAQSATARTQGAAVSIVGAFAIVVVGVAVYAVWVLR